MDGGLDLNLLIVLEALLAERSVTAAAGRVHRSVPATSRALARLRISFGDELLVRAGRELVLTPRGRELLPQVRAVLEEAAALTARREAFDPARLQRTFALRANDATVVTIGAALIATIRAAAPGVTIRFMPEGEESVVPFRDGTLDLDVGAVAALPPDIHIRPIGTDRYVGVARGDHPLLQRRVTAKRYAAAEHVSASRRGRLTGPIDEALAAVGLARRVVTTVGTIGAALSLVAGTDLVSAVPASAAVAVGGPLGLVAFRLPVATEPIAYQLSWHAQSDADLAHAWLRELVADRLSDALMIASGARVT